MNKTKLIQTIKKTARCDVDCGNEGTCCCYLTNPEEVADAVIEVLENNVWNSVWTRSDKKQNWEKQFDEKFPSTESGYQNKNGEYVYLFNPAVDVKDIKDFIFKTLAQQKKDIGEKFADWFYTVGGHEDIEDAIFRITGIRV